MFQSTTAALAHTVTKMRGKMEVEAVVYDGCNMKSFGNSYGLETCDALFLS